MSQRVESAVNWNGRSFTELSAAEKRQVLREASEAMSKELKALNKALEEENSNG